MLTLTSAFDELDPSQLQLSFAGCGFLCIYHAGVCAAVKEYAPQLTQNKIRGSSAGAIAAAGLLCNVCMSQATSTILQVVTQARAGSLQALSPNFDLMSLVRRGLEETLPDNAHSICNGRLFISATRARDYRNVVISEFDSREELIQAILCSSFIPFYCGRTPPSYRGEHYIDGGFSDNQPGKWDPGTITVSPFSGESDICPSDEDSASLLGFDFCGTSIQFTTRNLFRMIVTLFPPSPEVCSRICRQGFEDALRFLTKNHLAPCVRCLTVQSSAIPVPASANPLIPLAPPVMKISQQQQMSPAGQRIRELRRKRATTVPPSHTLANHNNSHNRHECDRCLEPMDRFEPPRFSGVPLPSVVQKTLAEMEARSRASWLNWLRQWRLIRWWLRLVVPPVMLPFEVLQFMLSKIHWWIRQTTKGPTETYLVKFQQLVDFLLQEVENRRLLHSSDIFPSAATPTAVMPVGPFSALRLTDSAKDALPSATQRKVSVQQRKPTWPPPADGRKLSTAMAPLDLAIPRERMAEWEEDEQTMVSPEDSMRMLRGFCEQHDAVLTYYYLDDRTNKLKLCQIFDTNSARQPARSPAANCSLNSQQFSALGEEEAQYQRKKSNRAKAGEEGAEGGRPVRRASKRDSGAAAEDSGLSLEEETADEGGMRGGQWQGKKDACCSPVRHLGEQSQSSRRHTVPGRPARLALLSASTRTLASSPRQQRTTASPNRWKSLNALLRMEAGAKAAHQLRRKVSARLAPAHTDHQRGCSSDSEETSAAAAGGKTADAGLGGRRRTAPGSGRKSSARARTTLAGEKTAE